MKNECLLYSAGIDSYIARSYLKYHDHFFDCLYFNHQGRYCKHEIEKIKSLDFSVRIENKLLFDRIERYDAFIPNRNLLMIMMANSLGYDTIWLGGSLSDRIGDNKSEVCDKLSKLLTDVNGKYIKVDSPFYGCYKEDMVRWYSSIYPDYKLDLLKDTFSCYNPLDESVDRIYSIDDDETQYIYTTKECMKCNACFRKAAVLIEAGIYIDFISEGNDIIQKYEKEFKNALVETSRSIATMKYINTWNKKHHYERKETSI